MIIETTTKNINSKDTTPQINRFPAQERIANPIAFKFERTMTEILVERLIESNDKSIVPVFVP